VIEAGVIWLLDDGGFREIRNGERVGLQHLTAKEDG